MLNSNSNMITLRIYMFRNKILKAQWKINVHRLLVHFEMEKTFCALVTMGPSNHVEVKAKMLLL